jgi:hypothetical protein
MMQVLIVARIMSRVIIATRYKTRGRSQQWVILHPMTSAVPDSLSHHAYPADVLLQRGNGHAVTDYSPQLARFSFAVVPKGSECKLCGGITCYPQAPPANELSAALLRQSFLVNWLISVCGGPSVLI